MKRNRIVSKFSRIARRGFTTPRVLILGLLTFLPLLVVGQGLYAAGSPAAMRVEEDWEVVLNQPDLDVDAPQFHTVISPQCDLESYYLQVCWNYREQTDFISGGMQLLGWQGDLLVGKKSYREDKLSTAAETITWTQAIQTNGSVLTFEILNGCSTTWGSFGGSDTSLSGNVGVLDLGAYSTSVSVANSWISYGANRVNMLQIKEVRYYDGAGNLIARDQTPKIVYQLQK